MQLFIDTGSTSEVEQIAPWGVISGATTNPTLLAREGGDPADTLRRIAALVDGPVSAEVVAADVRTMVAQGRALRALVAEGIPVNMTLVFSPAQALLAARAGASYVSLFMGRLDDIGVDSAAVVGEAADVLRRDAAGARLLAASIRSPEHVVQAARAGADVATVPAAVLRQMLVHPLTVQGEEHFRADWDARPELAQWLDSVTAAPST